MYHCRQLYLRQPQLLERGEPEVDVVGVAVAEALCLQEEMWRPLSRSHVTAHP